MVGVSYQQVQKYENGTNRISAPRLYQFSLIFNVPLDYFFESSQNLLASQYDKEYIADLWDRLPNNGMKANIFWLLNHMNKV